LVPGANNGVLGYQKDAETAKFGRYTSSGHLGRVDHAAITKAVGAWSQTVIDPSTLDAALEKAAAAGRMALIDVISEPGVHPPISLHEGTLDRMENGKVVQEPVP
jgi:acetolactate synthase I/II/III large subunit